MKTLFENNIWNAFDSWGDLMTTDGVYRQVHDYFSETEDGYSCRVNVAGIKKENIKAFLEKNVLKIEAEQDGHKYKTSITVPAKVDPELVSARCEDGMLYLELKKKPEHKAIELKIS